MLIVIDSDLGNTGSVVRALKYLNIQLFLTRELSEIEKADKIVFPGVGSFKAASDSILTKDFNELLKYLVNEKKIPILGICLGMQLFSEIGEEMGVVEGLGLIKGKTSRMRVDHEKYIIPHMGWNDVRSNGLKMFLNIPEDSCFYFDHSYEFIVADHGTKVATVNYGETDICAAVEKENIWGVQFHPEKSQVFGLEILKNFCHL